MNEPPFKDALEDFRIAFAAGRSPDPSYLERPSLFDYYACNILRTLLSTRSDPPNLLCQHACVLASLMLELRKEHQS